MTFNLVFLKDDLAFEEFEDRRVILPCCFEVESPEYELYFTDASNCFSSTDEIFWWYVEKLGGKSRDWYSYPVSFKGVRFAGSMYNLDSKNMVLPYVEVKLLDAGIGNFDGQYWLNGKSATRVYTRLSTFENTQDCILHYALTNGYSSTFCEHCGKPFLRKHKNTKFCTRYSPLQGYTDKQCGDAVNSAMTALRERLNKWDKYFRREAYYDEKGVVYVQNLRWDYLKSDYKKDEELQPGYKKLEELQKILDEEFPPKYTRDSDIIRWRKRCDS